MKRYLLLFFLAFLCDIAIGQKEDLVIGSRFKHVPDSLVEIQMESNDLNYVDILDYRILKNLVERLSGRYNIRFREVQLQDRTEVLITKDTSQAVDILLFSYSDSRDRRKRLHIEFSEPYFTKNIGIGIFARNEHLVSKDFEKGAHSIAAIKNSTAYYEIEELMAKNHRIKLIACNTYEDMVDSLLRKPEKACAILADVARMSYFLDKNPKIFYAGTLPAPETSTGDGFCVAINPAKPYLKKVVDAVFSEPAQKDKIALQQTLLLDRINQTLRTQELNLEKERRSTWILYGVPIGSLMILGFIVLFLFRKKNETALDESDVKAIKEAVQKASSKFLESFSSSLDTQLVLKAGIKSLDESTSEVLYVGSGGFMSSEGETGVLWRKAIYGCLNRGVKFIRIVDLPEKAFLFQKKKSKTYFVRFYTWLIIQYIDLRRYDKTLKLYDSRGAAYWGVGSIMLFCDEKSVLIFTSTEDGKMGTLLDTPNLVNSLRKDILATRELGEELTADEIMNRYFKEYRPMARFIEKTTMSLAPGEVISLATMKLIEERVRNLVDSLDELADDSNSAPV